MCETNGEARSLLRCADEFESGLPSVRFFLAGIVSLPTDLA
ncbi:hypothetical protein RISK_003936 [Rhodopirellula islandica]|uniref:Uncharacterized protein n=1 Tax=Rhodopirellula islandica TaxID=595434 RepID=A0A0J1BBF5_RHOIS|nr:hypothetical protein RISK_003936 [Rhodopirellula islandica]